jgi:hypothetical protein
MNLGLQCKPAVLLVGHFSLACHGSVQLVPAVELQAGGGGVDLQAAARSWRVHAGRQPQPGPIIIGALQDGSIWSKYRRIFDQQGCD